MQLRLIRNLSNSTGQKFAKISWEENPGITYPSVAAKEAYRVTHVKYIFPPSKQIILGNEANYRIERKKTPNSTIVSYE